MTTDEEDGDDDGEEEQQHNERSCTFNPVNNKRSSQIRSTLSSAGSVNKKDGMKESIPEATRCSKSSSTASAAAASATASSSKAAAAATASTTTSSNNQATAKAAAAANTAAAAATSSTASSTTQSKKAVSSTASSEAKASSTVSSTAAASPSTSARKKRNRSKQKPQPITYSMKSESRGRFFVTASINNKHATVLLDSGADLSLAPKWLKNEGIVTDLNDAFGVKSFDGQTTSHITQSVILTMKFNEATLTGEFFLADVDMMILGCDVLKDPMRRTELNTRKETFTVKDEVIKTAATPQESVNLFHQRQQEHKQRQKQPVKRNESWVAVKKTTTIPPHSTGSVNLISKAKENVFLSFFDEQESPIYVASVSMFNAKKLRAPVDNRSNEPITFHAGTILRRMCKSGADFNDDKVCVFTADEVGVALAEIFPNDASPEPEVAPSAPRPSTPVISVGISDLTDKEKIDEDTMGRCHTEGIQIDIDLEQREAFEPEIDVKDVDIEAEKQKSSSCKFWTDKTAFLDQFDLNELDDISAASLKETL